MSILFLSKFIFFNTFLIACLAGLGWAQARSFLKLQKLVQAQISALTITVNEYNADLSRLFMEREKHLSWHRMSAHGKNNVELE